MPIFLDGEVAHFQARAIVRTHKPKYDSPSAPKTGVIWSFDQALGYTQVVVCEGIFSAYAVGPHAVGILGKNALKSMIYRLLSMRPDEFVICLDSDAMVEAYQLARNLSDVADVRVCKLPKGDPESCGRKILSAALRESVDFCDGDNL